MQTTRSLSPEESAAFLEHQIRFAGRGLPVVDAMYALAQEWQAQHEVVLPARKATQDVSMAPLDPVDIVQLEVRLPPLPAIMLELQEVIHRRNSSAGQIAEVIGKDPGLAAWLLKLVNSPYYGFSAKVSTISRAVALVGTRQIQALSMGGALNSLAVLLPKDLLDMEQFWRHSIAAGIAAQEIWKLSGRADSEQIFVSGLLHDCGKLALAYAAPKVTTFLQNSFDYNAEPHYEVERKLIGFDHARLGGMLLHRWNMPLSLVMAVLNHHQVEDPVRYPEAAVVHIADALVTALHIATGVTAPVPPVSAAAWNVLGLAPAKLNLVAEMLQDKLDTICSAIR